MRIKGMTMMMLWKSERLSSFAARARNKVNLWRTEILGETRAEILKFKSETMMRKTLLCERVSRKRDALSFRRPNRRRPT